MAHTHLYPPIREAVAQIQRKKRDARRFPDHAMLISDGLQDKIGVECTRIDFLAALGEMVELEIIETGRTVNDTYVRLVEA